MKFVDVCQSSNVTEYRDANNAAVAAGIREAGEKMMADEEAKSDNDVDDSSVDENPTFADESTNEDTTSADINEEL